MWRDNDSGPSLEPCGMPQFNIFPDFPELNLNVQFIDTIIKVIIKMENVFL